MPAETEPTENHERRKPIEDRIRLLLEHNYKSLYPNYEEPLEEDVEEKKQLVEAAFTVIIDLYNKTKILYELSEKAKEAAEGFVESNEWEKASNAASVSAFFEERRISTANMFHFLLHPSKGGVKNAENIKTIIDRIQERPYIVVPHTEKGTVNNDKDDDTPLYYYEDLYY